MKAENAIVLNLDMDLGEHALTEAAILLPPTHSYKLLVAREGWYNALRLIKKLNCDTVNNPFSPNINPEIRYDYKPGEWSLWVGESCFWSPGA